jgi:hypothetical protein
LGAIRSLTILAPEFRRVCAVKVVRLTGRSCAPAGSFCAVTITGGSWNVGTGSGVWARARLGADINAAKIIPSDAQRRPVVMTVNYARA